MHEKRHFLSPKASPWRPNHVTICLLRHSGESLQNGQLELRRRNWYFARETHWQGYSRISLSLSLVRQDFERLYRNIVSASKLSLCGIPWGLRIRTHWSARYTTEWAWCGAARKSARLKCINLSTFASLRVDCAGAGALLYLGSPANCYSSRQHSRPA